MSWCEQPAAWAYPGNLLRRGARVWRVGRVEIGPDVTVIEVVAWADGKTFGDPAELTLQTDELVRMHDERPLHTIPPAPGRALSAA